VEIGGKPILWHILKLYSAHGINEFVTWSNGCSALARVCAFATSIRSCSLPSGVSGSARSLPGCIATQSTAEWPAISARLAMTC